MSKIKISMSQINTTVGSLDSNTKKIIEKITKAKKEKSNVICFPELSITGYPPEDLCLLYTSPSPRDKRQSRMPSSA